MNSLQNDNASASRTFINACSASCQKLVGKIEAAKRTLLNEFRHQFGAQEQIVGLALREAESLAHETGFPLLVFPTLAREKVEAVAAWQIRQQAMLRRIDYSRHAAA